LVKFYITELHLVKKNVNQRVGELKSLVIAVKKCSLLTYREEKVKVELIKVYEKYQTLMELILKKN